MHKDMTYIELNELRCDMRRATDAILGAAQAGLSRLPEMETEDDASVEYLSDLFCAILEACAFEDLANQRLSNLERALHGLPPSAATGDGSLMNGPAPHGRGLDQAAADALFLESPSAALASD